MRDLVTLQMAPLTEVAAQERGDVHALGHAIVVLADRQQIHPPDRLVQAPHAPFREQRPDLFRHGHHERRQHLRGPRELRT